MCGGIWFRFYFRVPSLFLGSVDVNGEEGAERCYCFLSSDLDFLLPNVSVVGAFMRVVMMCIMSVFMFTMGSIQVRNVMYVMSASVPNARAVFNLLIRISTRVRAVTNKGTMVIAPKSMANFLGETVKPSSSYYLFKSDSASANVRCPKDSYVGTIARLVTRVRTSTITTIVFMKRPSTLISNAILGAIVNLK